MDAQAADPTCTAIGIPWDYDPDWWVEFEWMTLAQAHQMATELGLELKEY